jgi:hypothetical protein
VIGRSSGVSGLGPMVFIASRGYRRSHVSAIPM